MNDGGVGRKVRNDFKILKNIKADSLAVRNQRYVPGELIVKFKGGEPSSFSKFSLAPKGLSFKEKAGKGGFSVFKITDFKSVEAAAKELEKDPRIEFAQPNFIYYPLEISSNDTYKNLLWGMDNTGQTFNGITGTADADIDAPEAWAINEGTNATTIVAVLDSGVAYNHPDLAANMWDGTDCKDENGDPLGGCNHGYDYYGEDNDPLPIENSHGTHVAGTIAAVKNNGEGVIGVAPNAKIMAVKVGETYLSDAAILKGIAFAGQNGARVINASWGGGADTCAGAYDEALYQAIENFDGLFVTSAGNAAAEHDGSSYFSIPSDFGHPASCWEGLDNVIGVAATNEDDGLAFFSDYGESFVDVGAPGGENPDLSSGAIYSTIAYSTVLEEDFEDEEIPAIPSGWVKEGESNNWRTASVSSSNVLYADSSFPYSDNASNGVTLPTYDLSDSVDATLSFSVNCDTEYDLEYWTDYLSIYLSSNGTDFVEALRLDEMYIDYLNGEDPYSSSSAASTYFSASLPSQYLTDSFKIKFGWVSDEDDNNYDGCRIDNLKIAKMSNLADGTNGTYDYMQGTSMAAPHVSGLAALVWGYNPNLALAQVRDVVVNTGDDLSSLHGKTVSGRRINAYNALNIFNPVIGDESDNVIPVSSISQATDGTGIVTVNFKVKDDMAGLSMTLNNFEYSLDGGSEWKTPTSSDASAAFSANWTDNSYISSLSFPTSSYSFTFNSSHSDFADFNGAQQDNVKIRFKTNDGAKNSPYAESGVFSIDNLGLDAPTISEPATTTYINADEYSIAGTANSGFVVSISREGSVIATSTPTSTAYTFTVPLNQNAVNTFVVYQEDNFGNRSGSVTSSDVIEDSSSTVFSLVSVGEDSASPYYTNDTTPQIVFSADDISPSLSCRWDASDSGYSEMSAENEFSTTVATSTNIVLPDQGSDGEKSVFVGCRDLAGNENSAEDNLDIVFSLDTVDPTAVLSNTPSSGTTARTASITVGGTGVAYYKYKMDSGSYSFSIGTEEVLSFSDLSVGSHSLSVIGGDEAGNWQDSASSTDYTWTISSSGGGGGGGGGGGSVSSDLTAPSITNIVATPTSGTTTVITWQTNESSFSWVLYGTTTSYGQQVKTSSYVTSHSVTLTGLTASTTYHYQIKSQDPVGNVGTYTDKTFTTLASGQTAAAPTSTAAVTSTASTFSPLLVPSKPVSQMNREELISFILQLIVALQLNAQTGGTTTGGSSSSFNGIPSTFVFNTNLKFGDNSSDVKYLQIVLNSDPDTRVASAGFGSSGYETIYFGNSTLAAVKKFQLKYRSELMDPFGLVIPAGQVGDNTRAKLNSILSSSH